jgi:MerR family transcriptional regulator, light-induced transcriptional regulator
MLIGGPSTDRHELGGLLAAAAAASEGWRVVYLGPDLPPEEIAAAAEASRARVVGLSVVYVDDRARVLGELRKLRERLPASIPLLVGGAGADGLEEALSGSGIRVITDLDSLRLALRRWAR